MLSKTRIPLLTGSSSDHQSAMVAKGSRRTKERKIGEVI